MKLEASGIRAKQREKLRFV